jgi:peptidyl-prolyl cis-trans isomerase D
VSDDEMKAYMKKREALYKIDEPTRSIEYVSFDVVPSAEDTARALGALNQIKNDFTSAADVESIVNRNSDDPYNNTFVNKKTFMSAYSDSIFNMPVGNVFGPYFENNTYKLTKVVEKKSLPDSAKIRHILIKTEERGQVLAADSVAKRRIDSVVAAINAGASFDTMVIKISEDEGSKSTGGEYTFTLQQRPQISKEFGDFAFEGTKGEKKTVKVDNEAYAGYHYIEILDQTGVAPAAKLATITKALYPGETTENAAYAKASEFAGKNNNAQAFDDAVKKANLNKKMADNVKVNDFQIAGLGSSREMIRWMYDAKVGDISQVFSLDGRYVVAKLSAKKDKGMMDLDANLRPIIEAAVRNEKKAKIIADKYKSGPLETIAQASGQMVQQADSFNGSQPFIPNLGYEPKVVGYTFFKGLNTGATSPAIKGQDGVFYISVLSRGSRPEPTDPNILQQMKAMQGMQLKSAITSGIDEMMRKSAEIEYNSKNL